MSVDHDAALRRAGVEVARCAVDRLMRDAAWSAYSVAGLGQPQHPGADAAEQLHW